MIEVDNIVKTYGDFVAVNHLSFKLEKGRIYGFLGPNGAGKSTTMNIMTGYIAADSGTVKINGHDILKEPEEAKAHVGYLPEVPPLYSDMTVGEYLRFVAELKKVPKKELRDHLARILAKTMLGDYENRMIRNLSKGYRQRVGLAQAMVGDPEVIILDEPTVGLDPQQINQMQDLMRDLKKDHIVVLSSHILSQVSEVCDYILIVSHGQLVAQGSEQELEEKENKEQVLSLRLLAEEDRIHDVLDVVAGVKSIEIDKEADSYGALKVLLKADAADITAEVATALSNAQIPVIEMTNKRVTLEDIFLTETNATPGISNREKLRAQKKAQKEAEKAAAAERKAAEKQEKNADEAKSVSADMENAETENASNEPDKEHKEEN